MEANRWILNVFWKWNKQHDLWTMIQAGKIAYCNFSFCIVINLSCCCSVTKSCPTLCNGTDCSIPGSAILHYLLEFGWIHIHLVGGATQPSHPLLPSSPFALNLSQHQDFFQWVSSLHQVATGVEPQLQHQSYQWIFRVDLFRIDWFDLFAIKGTLKSLLHHPIPKYQFFST